MSATRVSVWKLYRDGHKQLLVGVALDVDTRLLEYAFERMFCGLVQAVYLRTIEHLE